MERKIRKASMGSRIKWMLVMMMVVLEHNYKWCCCFGCLVEERDALLQIKADINYPDGSSLSFWSEEVTTNCCQWDRVECNHAMSRVVTIDLSYVREKRLGKWYLNASLFLPFEQLTTLQLGGNSFVGCVENEGFERLSILNRLETIYLYSNHFDNDILLPLSKLSSLRYLDLSDNDLKGSINFPGGFANLSTLNLGNNNIEAFEGIRDLGGASVLRNLENLSLYDNKFNNRTIKSLSRLQKLKYLDLSVNELHGTIPIDGGFANLNTLDLSSNNIEAFEGIRDLGGESVLRNLETLYLSGNKFNNRTIKSLSRLQKLKDLDLSSNELHGTIPIDGDFVNLNTLVLNFNNIEAFEGNRDLGGASVLRNLERLYLYGNKFNNRTIKSLSRLQKLKYLDLSSNELHGTIPIDDLDNLNNLEELVMSWNNIEGFTKMEGLRNLSNLEVLILDDSYVNKDLLQNIQVLTSLKALSLINCGLSGPLPNQDDIIDAVVGPSK